MTDAAPQRLSLADQTLINALVWLTFQTLESVADKDLFLATLREVLPGCNRRNPHMQPLIQAAENYLSFALGADAYRAFAGAQARARGPVLQFIKYRAACALDAWRAAQNEEVVQ